jgi:hypothetical protein
LPITPSLHIVFIGLQRIDHFCTQDRVGDGNYPLPGVANSYRYYRQYKHAGSQLQQRRHLVH